MRVFYLFMLMTCCFTVTIGFAQEQAYIFKNFTLEEGLPSNEAYCVFEDSKHYIWIGTDQGVVRYNGNKFQLFKLPDNVVFQVKEDRYGRIWFFTNKAKLAYLDNEKIHFFGNPDLIAKRLQRIQIVQAYFDSADNVVLASGLDSNYTISSSGEITGFYNYTTRIDQTTEILIDNPASSIVNTRRVATSFNPIDTIRFEVTRRSKKNIYTIKKKSTNFTHYGSIADGRGNIYFFGGTRVFKFMESGKYLVAELPSLILCLKQFENGILVGLRNKGALLLNSDLTPGNQDTILQKKSITSIATDYAGGLWFSTLESGVYYVKNTNIKQTIFKKFPDLVIHRTANLADSTLLLGTREGIFTLKNKKLSQLMQGQMEHTSDLHPGPNHTLFYTGAHWNQSFSVKQNLSGPFPNIYNLGTPSEPVFMKEDSIMLQGPTEIALFRSHFLKNGHLPANSANDTPLVYKTISTKPGKLFRDQQLNIWCGTNHGLYKFIPGADSMIKINDRSRLLDKGISCIRELSNGILVLGIQAGGIALFKDSVLVNITEKDGLLSNRIKYLLPLKDKLWIATGQGISVIHFSAFRPTTFTISNVGRNAGIFNMSITQLMEFNQKVAAVTSTGLYFFEKPDQFSNSTDTPMPFYVQNIKYYRGDTTGLETIRLPFGKTRLVLTLSAICFNAPEQVEYYYRFNNDDTSWNRTAGSELLIENLQQGKYNLQLKAVNKATKSSSATITIGIDAQNAWWQEPAFFLLAFFVVGAAIYYFYKYRVNKIKMAAQEDAAINAQMASLEQSALRSQMNPHFIFNCLTSIQQLILSGNKTDASEYLAKFAGLIRKTIDLSSKPYISIAEEKNYLEEYLYLEQLRLSGQFEYSIEASKSIEQLQIPNMMIQPVVENCIRHGIKSMENKKGNISITFKQHDKAITCSIKDNGIGRKKAADYNRNMFSQHKSYGIDILRRRLRSFEEIKNIPEQMTIIDLNDSDGEPAGTMVILHLPFKEAGEATLDRGTDATSY